MSTATIIVIIAIVFGIFSSNLLLRSIHTLFKDYTKHTETKDKKKQEKKIQIIEDKMKETLQNGSLSELLEVADELGKEKSKK